MKIKIRIRTPKGRALKVQKKLQRHIIGNSKVEHKVTSNKKDDTIIWDVSGDPRHVLKITRNVYKYDMMMTQILSNRKLRKVARLSKVDMDELDDMLKNQTEIKII